MRTVHRILSIFAALLMLYLGGTGTLIQLEDLRALLTHAPEHDPVIQSIDEGRYGNGDFPAISQHDLTAAALPAATDFGAAFEAVLAAMHAGTAQATPPNFVEVRMLEGRLAGQVKHGKQVRAYDVASGAAMATTPQGWIPMPDSLRQSTKELHRFWSRRDVPGVYFELASGIVLWVLLISGYTMYYKLWKARAQMGRTQAFWMGGERWRALHRVVALAASVFLLAVAFSGTFLGFESTYHTFVKMDFNHDPTTPMSDQQVRSMAAVTLREFRAAEPETPIKVLRVRIYGGMKQGLIVTGGASTRQLVYDTETGQPATLAEPGYPVSGFPFGTQMHEDIKHFHSGDLFGLPARFMNLLAGLALIFLSGSGVAMYVQLWRRRAQNGKRAWFWK
ncbi:hypothetical protein GJ699_07690 [Duganella sp. FT80W]|uniref:PepSY domain-containing protein n=1 Tax=Duganella guangzhouensis TaxID=2666084 RepID=A0A6I2KWD3_9BURK|nr:PepSY-associated TM helix domain-containing protein [Duganella guangzhouensis]MRW89862.1 hypothetical protein [Duganella guangzhouensis]